MYTAGGGGYSHTFVAKFQYMPGGQGGGWAPPTAGEASSISGRNANTTADTALRSTHGFIGHLSRGLCVQILRFERCPGARMAQMVATMVTTVQDFDAGSGAQRLLLLAARAGTPGCRVKGMAGFAGVRSDIQFGHRHFGVMTCERFGPTLQWRISVRALVSGLIVSPDRAQGATT
jgi:hypothetical protein